MVLAVVDRGDELMVLWMVALVPAIAVFWVVYWLATLPWRRAERCRLFLEVLWLGLREGKTHEQAIIESCATRDASIPKEMQWMALHLERGASFADSMARHAGFLPPDVQATLRWGAQRGRLLEAVELCRQGAGSRPNTTKGGMLAVGAMLLWPSSTAAVFLMIRIVILPKFRQIAEDFDVDAFGGIAGWMFEWGWLLALGVVSVKLLLYAVAFARICGPRLGQWLPLDRLGLVVPWRRQRLQRRFAQLLSLGLDLGISEEEAVVAAGAGTGNGVWRQRSLDSTSALRLGVRLDEAIATVDCAPEFRWRLGMAMHRTGRAMDSMRGWLADLESKADRNETMAAQSFLVFSVLSNATLVALTAVSVYSILISMMEAAAIW
ncbi:MAG: hypothetical protein DVB31_04545 [Verrucomicrobia bacterium]|nr:MAG: hypothetical protein DVB31_04545 [Verrucomicrobiota bacterium]